MSNIIEPNCWAPAVLNLFKGGSLLTCVCKKAYYFISCIFLLCLFAACSGEVALQTGLSNSDANEIVALLQKNGVSVTKTRDKLGAILTVREGQLGKANSLMQAAGLPRKAQTDFGQVFKKEGMISTPLEERARYLYALSQELEYTLSKIDGVIVARVHVVLPERVAPGEPVKPSSASVFLKVKSQFDEDLIVPRVKRLVTTSIPGLAGDDAGGRKITVVVTPAEVVDIAEIDWQQVGPFIIEDSSVRKILLIVYVLLVIFSILIGLVIFLGVHYLKALRSREKK